MRSRTINLLAFLLIVGAISYYDIRKCNRLPWPPRFIFAAIAFLMAELVSIMDERLGALTGLGMVLAIYLKILNPKEGASGFWTDCGQEIGGTGQPQTVAFLSGATNQPPSVGSVTEYQQQTTQQQTTGIPGPAPAMPPGTIVE